MHFTSSLLILLSLGDHIPLFPFVKAVWIKSTSMDLNIKAETTQNQAAMSLNAIEPNEPNVSLQSEASMKTQLDSTPRYMRIGESCLDGSFGANKIYYQVNTLGYNDSTTLDSCKKGCSDFGIMSSDEDSNQSPCLGFEFTAPNICRFYTISVVSSPFFFFSSSGTSDNEDGNRGGSTYGCYASSRTASAFRNVRHRNDGRTEDDDGESSSSSLNHWDYEYRGPGHCYPAASTTAAKSGNTGFREGDNAAVSPDGSTLEYYTTYPLHLDPSRQLDECFKHTRLNTTGFSVVTGECRVFETRLFGAVLPPSSSSSSSPSPSSPAAAAAAAASSHTLQEASKPYGCYQKRDGFGPAYYAAGNTKWGMINLVSEVKKRLPSVSSVFRVVHWGDVEVAPGKWNWGWFDESLQSYANSSMRVGLIFWLWPRTPQWLYDRGVPKICAGGFCYPCHLNSVYQGHVINAMDVFLKHLQKQPDWVRRNIAYIQSAEGTYGDETPYFGGVKLIQGPCHINWRKPESEGLLAVYTVQTKEKPKEMKQNEDDYNGGDRDSV
eukprot:jgi/Bigna1/146428/aug1.114_g21136